LIIQRFLFRNLRGGILLGLLSLCLYGSAQAGTQRILVLGDSISAAYGMSLEQGWVAMLAERLSDAEPGYEVVNASISGETTAGGLRRLPELLARHQPGLVIIELGANDGMRGYPLNWRRRLARRSSCWPWRYRPITVRATPQASGTASPRSPPIPALFSVPSYWTGLPPTRH
jgi:hypothetical protein